MSASSRAARRPLLRLLVPFAVLALVLVSIVLGLLHSALARLEEQRELRHRMVAERIFDELEREIGSVLQHEAERPSEAYDAAQTDPARWAPFVLGYYRRDPELIVLASERLAPERLARVRATLARAGAMSQADPPAAEGGRRAPRGDVDVTRPVLASSPDLLRVLNRSDELRERRMHDFARNFTVTNVDRVLVAERRARDERRVEGLLIDTPLLVQSVADKLFGSRELAAVPLLTLDASPPLGRHGDVYRYRQQLASPFSDYQVTLELKRLDDVDATNVLYGFAALFTVAAVFGLLAIYRTLVVQVAFAERRNNFVNAVTHELRTPLTTIRMYGEMLRDGMVRDAATQQEYYATITAEGERLTRLINNVMEHGRLRRGLRRAQLQRGDAVALVQEVVDMMRPHLEREGFVLELHAAAASGCNMQLDSDALKQILFNILDNARKYGRAEQARVEVTCEQGPAEQLTIRVRDYGPGVPEAQLEAIFEPFYRAEAELTREHQGTGLGLALVRDLVKLMHGRVHAHNRAPGLELCVILGGGA